MGRRKRVATPPLNVPKKGRTSPPNNKPSTSTNPPNTTDSMKTEAQPSLPPPTLTFSPQRVDHTSPEPSDDESLSSESFSDTNSQSTNESGSIKQTPLATSRERIPPIIIDPTHWATAAPKIMPLFTQDQLTAKFSQNSIKLQAADSNIFRSVQTIMGSANIPFHTFSLPAERQLKVLLRGIPSHNSEDSVRSELVLLGYTVSHVRQFLKDGRKLPMYMICLPNSQESKHIFELSNLFYVGIRVEAYKTSGPSQCFACQGFGHSSAHCKHQPKCVKCGNDHATKFCTKTPDQPPKCCNCNGEHTANYRKCPAFIKATIAKKTNSTITLPQPTPQDPTTISYAKQSTYAQALTPSNNHHHLAPVQPPKKINKKVIDILNHAIYQISSASNFKDTILLAISAIVSLINQDG